MAGLRVPLCGVAKLRGPDPPDRPELLVIWVRRAMADDHFPALHVPPAGARWKPQPRAPNPRFPRME